ncbi:hypothetical protein ACA910_000984 [Epithemia clementina (nom. ined.)]
MPANLDDRQQHIILTFTTVGSAIILSIVVYVSLVEIPRLEKRQHQQYHTQNHIPRDDSYLKNCSVLYSCLTTFIYMAFATTIFVWPIVSRINPHVNDDTTRLTSSINFCETDFRHTRYIAEPTNAISSIAAYLPLALIGGIRSTKTPRYLMCYATIFLIGVGSTLLHTFLTAVTQGGDELPMLWYTAATSYCAFDVIFSGIPGVGMFFILTAILSTGVYLQCRANFTYFYLLFTTYTVTLTLSLIYITLFMNWENKPNGADFKRRILVPLMQANSIATVFATWCWVAEMLGCESASQRPADDIQWFIWNLVLHPFWHFATGIVSFLVVQVIHAAEGFARGRGMPSIVWVVAPFVVFDADKKLI